MTIRSSYLLLTLSALLSACPGATARITIESNDGLSHNELTYNALLAAALQGNQHVRTELANNPLNQATLDSLSANVATSAEYARSETQLLMKYIVSCALSEMHSLKAPGGDQAWPGELGLCQGWADLPPSVECQEIVSSCVLARANAVGKKVVISMRGDNFSLLDKVPVEMELRERRTPPSAPTASEPFYRIQSWNDCSDSSSAAGAARNCQWRPLYVGRCTAGASVTASVDDDSKMLRVCKGLYGCENQNTALLPPAAARYAGGLGEGISAVTFTCPGNGPAQDPANVGGARYGYFSMMIAYQDTRALVDPDLANLVQTPVSLSADQIVTYPANEEQVFAFREGGFYGNLFEDVRLTTQSSQLALPGSTYACYNDAWSCSLAELTDRFCAGLTELTECSPTEPIVLPKMCFDNVPRPCSGGTQVAPCSLVSSTTGFHEQCVGDKAYPHPITVYLNNPCDLMGERCDPDQFLATRQ